MVEKLGIAAFVDEDKVPMTRRGGPGNPALTVIVEQLIQAADEGNTSFAFIPVEDKTERRRTGESIRNQLRARGYNTEKVSGVGKVPGSKQGKVRTVEGLYMRASPIDIGKKDKNTTHKKKRIA